MRTLLHVAHRLRPSWLLVAASTSPQAISHVALGPHLTSALPVLSWPDVAMHGPRVVGEPSAVGKSVTCVRGLRHWVARIVAPLRGTGSKAIEE